MLVHDRVYHIFTPPWPIFHGRYLDSRWNSVTGANKIGFGNVSPRELADDVPFAIGTLLVVEQSSLEKPPQGGAGVMYTVIHRTTGFT